MTLHRDVMLLGALILALAGCEKKTAPAPEHAGAVQEVIPASTDPAVMAIEKELDQHWTPANRAIWYERSQGSRLMPLSWLYALEDNAGNPLFSEENVKRWGYLPRVNSKGRPLPVGFTEDVTPDVRLPKPVLTWRKVPTADDRIWVGMNCSACHTAQLTYKDKTLTVDGGPALADFEGFMGEVRKSLDATEKDDARFGRFAERVLGEKPLEPWKPGATQAAVEKVKDLFTKDASDDKTNRAMLRAALGKVAARERELARLNASTGASDYGRLDAFGHIFNKVAMVVRAKDQAPNPADAPVSYPFLWNVPQHDRVQWNGIAPKRLVHGEDVGALARNAGEVIGVFGDIEVQALPRGLGYPSSLNVAGLNDLERQLTTLRPPAWPATIFGWNEIKDGSGTLVADHAKLVADGRKLFGEPGGKGRCIACHQVLPDRTDVTTPIVAQMALFNPAQVGGSVHRSTGTDIWMACNAYTRNAATGLMAGSLSGLKPLGPRADLAVMLKTMVIRGLLGQGEQAVDANAGSIFLLQRPPQALINAFAFAAPPPKTGAFDPETRCLKETSPILGYKGRPLNGIWATAPYLHNGSVRTLYQLLLPPEQREASFAVGNREFDPKEVGYVNSTAGSHSVLTAVAGGKPVRANSNAGHDYGNGKLTDYDRWALIEYMKTL